METLLLVLTNAIGGSTYSATVVMQRGFTPRDALFVRMAVCSLLFLPVVWRARGRLAALAGRDWTLLSVIGLVGYALPLSLGNLGLNVSTSTSAALIMGVEPVSIVLLAWLFLGERLTGGKVAALAAGLLGAFFIAFQGLPRLDALSARTGGDLILAASAFCWGVYTVVGKPLLGRVEPLEMTAVTTVIAFLGIAAWTGPALHPADWARAGGPSWTALLYLAAIGSCLGALFWNLALRSAEASRQANFVFLQPVVGAALGAGFLGDPVTRWTAAGGALVLAGMWAATRGEPR